MTKDTGWYYHSVNDRAAAWTGVEYLYRFLTNNTEVGPAGRQASIENIEPGDIIQLYYQGLSRYTHSLIVTETGTVPAPSNILVCAHTMDVLDRPLSQYLYAQSRHIHIDKVAAP